MSIEINIFSSTKISNKGYYAQFCCRRRQNATNDHNIIYYRYQGLAFPQNLVDNGHTLGDNTRSGVGLKGQV